MNNEVINKQNKSTEALIQPRELAEATTTDGPPPYEIFFDNIIDWTNIIAQIALILSIVTIIILRNKKSSKLYIVCKNIMMISILYIVSILIASHVIVGWFVSHERFIVSIIATIILYAVLYTIIYFINKIITRKNNKNKEEK